MDIAHIIGIMTIGDAMTSSVSGQLSSFGTNNITLSVQERGTQADMRAGFERRMEGGSRSGSAAKQPESDDLITDRMIAELAEAFAGQLAGISISYPSGSAKAQEGDLYANISITGVNADYGAANNVTMLSGSFIAESDADNKSQAAVVSLFAQKQAFPALSLRVFYSPVPLPLFVPRTLIFLDLLSLVYCDS